MFQRYDTFLLFTYWLPVFALFQREEDFCGFTSALVVLRCLCLTLKDLTAPEVSGGNLPIRE